MDNLCSQKKCEECLSEESSADCIRQKAMHCMRAAKSVEHKGTRDALEGLAFVLMEEARALDREQSILQIIGDL